MGCCNSTSSSSSPYPAQPSASSRAINNSQPGSQTALPRPSTNHTTSSQPQPHTQPHPHHHHHPALNERFNRPLRKHVWTSKKRRWTRREIDREREAFFDTRVTGHAEIWLALRAALEVLWASGDPEDESNDGGIATASMILEAAGITLPTGDLANGAYDSFGAAYQMPEWVIADPVNIALEEDVGKDMDKDREDSEAEEEQEAIRRREEKGKTVLAAEDMISVKARLSDRGGPAADVVVHVGKADSVRLLAKKVSEEATLPTTKHIRLVYMGKMLKEHEPLLTQGWKDGHVVNALVFG